MRKALAIGINNYPSAPLRSCVNDAKAIAEVLKTNSDGSPNFDVKTKTNINKKSALAESIGQLFEGYCETALLYFSGHGYVNELGGYLVTPDATAYNEGVAMTDVLTWANKSPAQHKIVILDCCYSGTMGAIELIGNTISVINKGVTILAASLEDQVAIEMDGHGIFTGLLLDALKGGAADLKGDITPGSVYTYIDQVLGPWYQRPMFKANISGFTPLRSSQPSVSRQVLRKLTAYFPDANDQFPLSPDFEPTSVQSNPEKNIVFKNLQKLESVGLVIPVGEEHMYYAVFHSTACKLTDLGRYYWQLANSNRI